MFRGKTTLKREITKQSTANWKRNIIILIVLQFTLGLIYLKTVPRLISDEAWDASFGHSLAYSGVIKCEIIEGFGGMHIHLVQPRLILPLVCAAIFKVAGYSITASRFGSLLFGVLAIVSLYGVMRTWFGERQAVWIAAATVLHPWFFEISRRVRPEIYHIALAMTMLWCIVYSLDSNSRRTSFFAGVFATLAVLAHPSGLVLDIAIVGAVLIWLRTKTIWRLVLWACLGSIVAILPYVIYVLWCVQYPGVNFFEQMQTGHRQIGILAGEVMRWKNFLRWPKGAPIAIVIIVFWLLTWYRSTSADKVLASIIGLFTLILPFISANRAGRYLVVLVPFFCAMMVRLIWRIMPDRVIPPQKWYKLRFVVSKSIIVIYFLMCVAAISAMFYYLRGADFTKVLDRIASVVNREDHIYGERILWIGHDRYHYGPFPVDYSVTPWRQPIEEVRKHHFDYAVRSVWTFDGSAGISSPPTKMPDFRSYYTIDQVCKRFGTKIDEFYDPYFGPFEIYKLDNWGDGSNSEDKK